MFPDSVGIRSTLGRVQYRLGKFAQADETFTEALTLASALGLEAPAETLAWRGMALHKLGRQSEACDLVQKANKIKPSTVPSDARHLLSEF
jgi:uncharacterized protein HemY